MTSNQNPFFNFDQLLTQLIDAHMEEDLEHLVCEACDALYEAFSRDGRCGECSYCATCCQHPVPMFWWKI